MVVVVIQEGMPDPLVFQIAKGVPVPPPADSRVINPGAEVMAIDPLGLVKLKFTPTGG